MLYFVTTDSASAPQVTPQELASIVEHMVIPSIEALSKLLADKKILAGGIPVGARQHVFIVEADSNDEVVEILQNLPFYILHKWEVTPLESWEHHTAFVRRLAEQLKAASH